MFEIIYRYDPSTYEPEQLPASALEARQRLEAGNREFAELVDTQRLVAARTSRVVPFDPMDLGLDEDGEGAPKQEPYAVVLGCSDARVPTELVFNQACNDLFVVRLAGNVLSSECLGSIEYAVRNLAGSLRILVVLAHSGCGAVTAAVDSFLDPTRYHSLATSHPLRSIVDRIRASVRSGTQALEEVYGSRVAGSAGYRRALIETTVTLNAAMTAFNLGRDLFGDAGAEGEVVYGVYNLETRRVHVPGVVPGDAADDEVHLVTPPGDVRDFAGLGLKVAGAQYIERLLKAK